MHSYEPLYQRFNDNVKTFRSSCESKNRVVKVQYHTGLRFLYSRAKEALFHLLPYSWKIVCLSLLNSPLHRLHSCTFMILFFGASLNNRESICPINVIVTAHKMWLLAGLILNKSAYLFSRWSCGTSTRWPASPPWCLWTPLLGRSCVEMVYWWLEMTLKVWSSGVQVHLVREPKWPLTLTLEKRHQSLNSESTALYWGVRKAEKQLVFSHICLLY